MADEEQEETEEVEEEAAPKKSKKPLFLGGGIVGLIGVGYLLMTLAMPAKGKDELIPYNGPFHALANPTAMQVSLAPPGQKYLMFNVAVSYLAYDEVYVTNRMASEDFSWAIQDKMITVGLTKNNTELASKPGQDLFKNELRDILDQLIFPLHIGAETPAEGRDEESGLAPGLSLETSSYARGIMNGVVYLDVPAGTIRLDEGEIVNFNDDDGDLELVNESGETLYVDVSTLNPEFVGEVAVGRHGTVKEIKWTEFKRV